MKKLIILMILISLMFTTSASAEYWTYNTSYCGGLPYNNEFVSTDTIEFNDELITVATYQSKANYHDYLYIYENEIGHTTDWTLSDIYNTGLTADYGDWNTLTGSFIIKDETLYLLVYYGNSNVGDDWYRVTTEGWKWTGTEWVFDSSIVNGLPNQVFTSEDDETRPYMSLKYGYITTFEYETAHYAFYTGYDGHPMAYRLEADADAWVEDYEIIDGIPDRRSHQSFFMNGDTLYLIVSVYTEQMHYGYEWSGSTWISNNTISEEIIIRGWSQPVSNVFKNGDTLINIVSHDEMNGNPVIDSYILAVPYIPLVVEEEVVEEEPTGYGVIIIRNDEPLEIEEELIEEELIEEELIEEESEDKLTNVIFGSTNDDSFPWWILILILAIFGGIYYKTRK